MHGVRHAPQAGEVGLLEPHQNSASTWLLSAPNTPILIASATETVSAPFGGSGDVWAPRAAHVARPERPARRARGEVRGCRVARRGDDGRRDGRRAVAAWRAHRAYRVEHARGLGEHGALPRDGTALAAQAVVYGDGIGVEQAHSHRPL